MSRVRRYQRNPIFHQRGTLPNGSHGKLKVVKGPRSQLYDRSLTSCFLDVILIPLCTWLFFSALLVASIIGNKFAPFNVASSGRFGHGKDTQGTEADQSRPRRRIHIGLAILYYLLILAQCLMCILEIVRLSITHLGIGLLPFTLVGLLTAAAVRFTKGLHGRVYAWTYLNLALWVSLAITNGVKIAQETKEGTGARKGSKYPVADEITDVAVMIGVYAVLAVLEMTVR
ncbi:MAG: hypothetical protein Q9219_007295 [cf. Caloplaca sp. 3 TL-2023]